MAKFTADLRNLKRRMRQIKSPRPLIQSGFKTIDLLTREWDDGKGGDGRRFARKISDAYAAKKEASGRKPIINLSWTGAMRRAMTVLKRGAHKVHVTFADTLSMNKARGNFELRPSMMKVGSAMRNKIVKHFYKKMKEA